MRNMSFSATKRQILDQTKHETRRLGWDTLVAGELVQPIEKGQGLKKGAKVVRLGCPIQCLSNRRERLDAITRTGCELEGFPELMPKEFVAMFCKLNRCCPSQIVNVIAFTYQRSHS